MRVAHHGPTEAPPLLLIHGSGAAGASWALMVPALARRHHVLVVDLPDVRPWAVPEAARQLAALLDRLGLSGVAVAGHSSGGYTAVALAELRPDLVGPLALLGTGPSLDALLPSPLILRALLGPPLGALIWAVKSDAWIRRGAAATAAHPVEVPDEMVAAIRTTTYRAMRAVLRGNEDYLRERTVPDRLRALAGRPVLVLHGAADPRWDPASIRQYQDLPDVRVELLPDVGHVIPLEAPAAAADLLLSFTAP